MVNTLTEPLVILASSLCQLFYSVWPRCFTNSVKFTIFWHPSTLHRTFMPTVYRKLYLVMTPYNAMTTGNMTVKSGHFTKPLVTVRHTTWYGDDSVLARTALIQPPTAVHTDNLPQTSTAVAIRRRVIQHF